MQWIKDTFGTYKPIIAMCHIRALPGDPYYDNNGGMDKVIELTRKDLCGLQRGGVDAVMFSNEFSLPYLTRVKTETVAAMARIIGELMDMIEVPFGVNVLWDPIASIDLAVATGAKFVREIMSGVYASDFGLWNTNVGETYRHRANLGAKDLKMFFNILPEAAKYLADRDIVDIAKSTVFNNRPDALCVSGLTAGSVIDIQALKRIKSELPDIPVFCNTGCTKDNVEMQLSIADGAIVGTTFKEEGKFDNFVDQKRVAEFMKKVKQFREKGVKDTCNAV